MNVTYDLSTPPKHDIYDHPATRLRITIRALNTRTDGGPLPWTASWHPYFAVTDVSTTKVSFDSCGGAWRHLLCGPGAPRGGDLIPTGQSEEWTLFDGNTSLGGTAAKPTYFDDEYTSTLAANPLVPRPRFDAHGRRCGPPGDITNVIIDGDEQTVVVGEGMQFQTWQIFTGAKEGWGWDAIALEPMSGLADAFNNGKGLTVLMPGEAYEGSFSVHLE